MSHEPFDEELPVTRSFHLDLSAVALLALLLTACELQAQRASQRGSVSQTVDETVIQVVYNRPVARGRVVFGELVPFGEVWHPGANEATTLRVSGDVTFAGEALPAGEYTLWTIPRDGGPWTVIVSEATDVWHHPYPEGRDLFRVEVEPEGAEHMETMAFYFPVVGPDHAVLALHWEETRIPISIELSP